jgi:uncharacterized membrane protein HdeD (DUF308 family)
VNEQFAVRPKELHVTSSSAVPNNQSAISRALPERVTGFSVFLSILMIACGFLAILLPIEMSFGVVIVVAWLLMFSGLTQFVHLFRCKGVGSGIWKALIGVIYFVTGLYLRLHLGLGIAAVTLALVAFFVSQGLVDILVYFRTRRTGISRWLLLDGVTTLILGLMIWRHWPNSSLWVMGILVGLNMIMTGATRFMLTLAVRRAMKLAAQPA